MLDRDEVAKAIGLVQEKNPGIERDIRGFFKSLINAHNLFLDIQKAEKGIGPLERCVGGWDVLAKKVYGINRLKMIAEMKEQVDHYHGSADYERTNLVHRLDENSQELQCIRDGLKTDGAEWKALNAAIGEYARFTWAFRDLRADMMNICTVPNVQDIFWKKLAEMEMEAGEA